MRLNLDEIDELINEDENTFEIEKEQKTEQTNIQETEKILIQDNQLNTAIDILKGIKVYEKNTAKI